MAKLKVRFELNKGRTGIPFTKLIAIAGEAQRFLDMLAEDIGVKSPKWVAKEFDNNSVDFNCECLVDDDFMEARGYRAMRTIVEGRRDDVEYSGILRRSTWRQFAEIFKPIDDDEVVGIGIFNGNPKPEHFPITRERFVKESQLRPKFATYYGEIQGTVHAFFKDSEQPKLVIRELSSKELIDCFFDKGNPDMYHAAIEVLQDKDAVVFVEGEVEENCDTGVVNTVRAKDFRPAPQFNLIKFKGNLGAFPDITGSLTTEKFIEGIRGDVENP